MNLFDKLVTEALKNTPKLSGLRVVVEKELLHHDILRILSYSKMLHNLTFIGGTCLRVCYGGTRLSEDLDFTGGSNFSRSSLALMSRVLIESLQNKYGLSVSVSEPIEDKNNFDTWKIKIETRPSHRNLPAQRINIDICALPSYEKRPMMLLNPYLVDMGTSGLIIQAQSLEEIYADKLLAFALRPDRLKYRDIWDILWLYGRGLKPRLELIPLKLKDRNLKIEYFQNLFDERTKSLTENAKIELEFKQEMSRFISADKIKSIIEQEGFWTFAANLMKYFGNELGKYN